MLRAFKDAANARLAANGDAAAPVIKVPNSLMSAAVIFTDLQVRTLPSLLAARQFATLDSQLQNGHLSGRHGSPSLFPRKSEAIMAKKQSWTIKGITIHQSRRVKKPEHARRSANQHRRRMRDELIQTRRQMKPKPLGSPFTFLDSAIKAAQS